MTQADLEQVEAKREAARLAWRNEWSGKRARKFREYILACAECVKISTQLDRCAAVERN